MLKSTAGRKQGEKNFSEEWGELSMAYYVLPHGGVAPQKAYAGGQEARAEENPLKWTRSFAIMLTVATVIAVALNCLTLYRYHHPKTDDMAEEAASKVIVIQARPTAAATPSPMVSSLRLYACGGELSEDGFTMYVEDRPIEISIETEPKFTRPPVYWSVSDEKAASLVVSDDRKSCKISALKPAGRIEMTVSCYGAETTIPVYLWNR